MPAATKQNRPRIPNRPVRRAARAGLVIAMLAGLVAAVALRAEGYTAALPKLSGASVWLANTNAGIVTLLNGTTNEAVWRVKVAEPGETLTTTQMADGVVVHNPNATTLKKVSSAKLNVAADTTTPPGAQRVAARDNLLYVLPDDPAQPITRHDAATLEQITVLPLSGGSDGLVDQDGWLWVLQRGDGNLHAVQADQLKSTTTLDNSAAATMALTTDGIAVVDPAGQVTLVSRPGDDNPEVARRQLSISAAGWLPAQSDSDPPERLALLDPDGGKLGVCPSEGDCTLLSLAPHGRPGDRYGTPQHQGGLVFIPNHTNGNVIIVELATSTVRQQVQVIAKPAPFELLAHNGKVWFNNPASNEAGIIDPDGQLHPIQKYRDGLEPAAVAALAIGGSSPVGAGEGLNGTGTGQSATEGAIGGETTNGTSDTDNPSDIVDPAAPPPSTADAGPQSSDRAAPDADNPDPKSNNTDPPEPSPGGAGSTPEPGNVSGASTGPDDNIITDGGIEAERPETTGLKAIMALSADVAAPGDTVRFGDRSTGDPTARLWNFGDGTTSTDTNPQHAWTKAGIFTVTLTVTKNNQSASTTQRVTITDALTANFTAPTTARVGEPVRFTNNSIGDIKSYHWDFGDRSAPSDRENPSHNYSTAGRYTVTLSIGGANSTSATDRKDLVVVPENRPPIASDTSVTLAGGTARELFAIDLGISDADNDALTLEVADSNGLPPGTKVAVTSKPSLVITAGLVTGSGTVRFIASDAITGAASGIVRVNVLDAAVRRAPGAPALRIAASTITAIDLDFAIDGVDLGTSPLASYVARHVESGIEYTSTTSRVRIANPTTGIEYTFVAFLESNDGRSPGSQLLKVVVAPAPPQAPTDLRATVSDDQITVSWDSRDPSVVQFAYGYAAVGIPVDRLLRTAATTVTYAASPGDHIFSVVSMSANGESAATEIGISVADFRVPSAPLNFRTQWAGDVTTAVWDAPQSSGLAPILKYSIRDNQHDKYWDISGDWRGVVTVAWVPCSLDGSGTVSWSIQAHNAFGVGPWATSIHDQPGFCVVPPAPNSVTAKFVPSSATTTPGQLVGHIEVSFTGDDAEICTGPLRQTCASPKWVVSVAGLTLTMEVDAPGTFLLTVAGSCGAISSVDVYSTFSARSSPRVTELVTGIPPCPGQ